jgi:hypothetical protein
MAHRSKKKHLKHLHQHAEASSPPPAKKHAGAKADIEADRVARPPVARAGAKAGAAKQTAAPKKRGIVRSLARAATKKITARPKKIIQRAKSRVKSMLGRE